MGRRDSVTGEQHADQQRADALGGVDRGLQRVSGGAGGVGAAGAGSPNQNTRFRLRQPPAFGLLTPMMMSKEGLLLVILTHIMTDAAIHSLFPCLTHVRIRIYNTHN